MYTAKYTPQPPSPTTHCQTHPTQSHSLSGYLQLHPRVTQPQDSDAAPHAAPLCFSHLFIQPLVLATMEVLIENLLPRALLGPQHHLRLHLNPVAEIHAGAALSWVPAETTEAFVPKKPRAEQDSSSIWCLRRRPAPHFSGCRFGM